MMDKIEVPYNFVPLSKKVFFPDWAGKVSQDVPFSDGICGIIGLEITANTPLYIRNGGSWPEENEKRNANSDYKEFFYIEKNGKYYIPGSSIKGMIRNVVEIASFGKMIHTNDNRYGYRDLSNKKEYINRLTKRKKGNVFVSKVKAGWLKHENKEYHLYPCEYAKIEQNVLEKAISKKQIILRAIKSAKDKYIKWEEAGNILLLDCEIKEVLKNKRNIILQYNQVIKYIPGNSYRIVFTGQAGRKHNEFVFSNRLDMGKVIDPALFKDFEFIHSDDQGNPNTEWGYWKTYVQKGEKMPVFYIEDSRGEIEAFGLAQMFRLPYHYTVHDLIENLSVDHLSGEKADLAETIFGYTYGNNALKGRVHVGHCTANIKQGSSNTYKEIKTTLLGPKPTFYPNYLKQKYKETGRLNYPGDYTTYNHKNARIRGWKRYPVPRDGHEPHTPEPETEKVATAFTPLPAGTTFTGNIRIHNLRPKELGAVLWALTWGNNPSLRHSIGMGKPYGFGSIKIAVKSTNLKNISGESIEWKTLLYDYKKMMEEEIPGWENTEQLKQLLAMANPEKSQGREFMYPDVNKFRNYKKNHFVLLPYVL